MPVRVCTPAIRPRTSATRREPWTSLVAGFVQASRSRRGDRLGSRRRCPRNGVIAIPSRGKRPPQGSPGSQGSQGSQGAGAGVGQGSRRRCLGASDLAPSRGNLLLSQHARYPAPGPAVSALHTRLPACAWSVPWLLVLAPPSSRASYAGRAGQGRVGQSRVARAGRAG